MKCQLRATNIPHCPLCHAGAEYTLLTQTSLGCTEESSDKISRQKKNQSSEMKKKKDEK